MNIKICFWNSNGIRQHKHELELFLINNKIDVMLISETHLTSRSYFKISGYTLYDTKDPQGRACGGSGILIKSRLKHHLMAELSENYIQATNICIEFMNQNLVISSVYSPPRHSISHLQYSDFFQSLGYRFIAAGDFNSKHTYWGSRLITPKGRILYETISKLGLDVISSGEPTYWPTDRRKLPDVIDFGVTKNIPRELVHTESSFDLSSDHSPVIITLFDSQSLTSSPELSTFSHTNWLKYRKYLSTHCTENISLTNSEDINLNIENLNNLLQSAIQHSTISHQRVRFNNTQSADIEQLLNEKRRARREWQLHRSPNQKIVLKECTKKLKKLLDSKKTASFEKYLEGLDATPQSSYSLWRATKNFKRPIVSKPPLRNINGDWARSDNEKGNLFVNHLTTVFTPNPPTEMSVIPPTVNRPSMALRFTKAELETTIANLNVKKATGMDKISNKMIFHLPQTAVRIMLFIFNAILRLEYYPQQWKISQIIMIPKPGKDLTLVDSYRPISLLPVISKIFEKLLLSKILRFLNDTQCIPNHQFGFRSKHGTIEQTHRLVQVIRNTFERKRYCSALFIDVSQAFDKVWHQGLMYKLRLYLPENLYNLLCSYITCRQFVVKERDFISDPSPISAGVPQGSILGPTLYLIYTSDMPTSKEIHTSTFADDTAILSVNESPQEASHKLQIHVHLLEKWLQQWRIKINERKCSHITFTLRKETCVSILINNQIVPQHSEVKYLGVHLDRRLTWKYHVEAKITQIKLTTAKLHWLIGRNSVLKLDCKLLLYKSLLKPIWYYGIQLWGTASATTIEKIQRQQNKILRMITAAPWYIKNSNIHKDLNIPVVKAEATKSASLYIKKLEFHPNPLARNILNYVGHIRLKRRDTAALLQTSAS